MREKGLAMLPIVIAVIAIAVLGGGYYLLNSNSKNTQTTSKNTTTTITPTDITPTTNNTVPLPTEEDIIRTFFNLINEKRYSEAVMMMSKANTQDDSTKQQWGVSFSNLDKVTVKSIEKFTAVEPWTETKHVYKVTLDIAVKSGSQNYTLFENGETVRWVPLSKEDNLWKIDGLATGP